MFRLYLLASLIDMQQSKSKAIPVPDTAQLEVLSSGNYGNLQRLLGGLTSSTYGYAADMLHKAGLGRILGPDAGSGKRPHVASRLPSQ